jgi:hypothetical protein
MKIVHRLSAPKWCNCRVWAYYRWKTRGGYICYRRSFYSPRVNHAFWSRDMITWWGYTARDETPTGPWWRACWFQGHVVMGDAYAISRYLYNPKPPI